MHRRSLVGLVAAGLVVASVGLRPADAQTSGPSSQRIAGLDRYETAVRISEAQWEAGSAVTVFLANGTASADALAMGASTKGEGPILLVKRDELPNLVQAEITRLQPCRIVGLGGPGLVSDAVMSQAAASTTGQGC